MASFFRKLSDIFTGKYKEEVKPVNREKRFWDVRLAQSLEKAGFSEKESEAFVKKMKNSSKTGEVLAVDFKDIMHVGQECAVSEIIDNHTARVELKQGNASRSFSSYFVNKKLPSSEIRRLKRGKDCSQILVANIAADPSITKLSLTNKAYKQDVSSAVLAYFVKGLEKTNVQSFEADLEYGPEVSAALGQQLALGKIKEVSLAATSASAGNLEKLDLGKAHLTSFSLNSSDLGQVCLDTLSKGMPKELKSLSLTNRPISPDVVDHSVSSAFIQALPEGLESLKLENIRMDGSEKELGEALKKMPSLKEFVYNGPDVGDKALVALAEGLAASNVEKVDFSRAAFTNKGVNAFLDVLEKSGSKIKETGFLKKGFELAFSARYDLDKATIARIQKFEQNQQAEVSQTAAPLMRQVLMNKGLQH